MTGVGGSVHRMDNHTSASKVSHRRPQSLRRLLVFNVKGNKYRLIVRVDYPNQELYIKALLTHAEYDKRGWMKWA